MFFQARDKTITNKMQIKNYPDLSCFIPDSIKIKKMQCTCTEIRFCKRCILAIKIDDYPRWLRTFNLDPGYN